LERADQNLRDAVTEANESLRSLRVITDNIGAVTSDISSFSRSIRDTGEEIRRLTGCVNNLGNAVQSVGTEAAASIRGVRAGFKTGFEVLLKDLFR
jgi:ABC-type transporter Mla subunit MlaD